MVPRDEFDAIKAVAVKAREAQEGLEVRIAALEVEITKLKKSATRNPRKKAALNTSD
jgi:BMFP domain-containing protein YqiC